MTQSIQNTKKAILKKVQSLLDKNDVLKEFAYFYLDTFSLRSLKKRTPADLASFIKHRFNYVQSSLSHDTSFLFTEPQIGSSLYTFEYVCTDAPHMLITIEELFHDNNIRIVKKHHPILSIETTPKHKIKSVQKAEEGKHLISTAYFEFEWPHPTTTLKELEKKVAYHFKAIHTSFNDHLPIKEKIQDIKNKISQSKVTIDPPASEWINLLDWLENQNFSFFSYGELTHGKKSIEIKNGLGLLQKDYLKSDGKAIEAALTDHATRMKNDPEPFHFDAINCISPLQRFDNLMRLSFKFDTTTEYVFLGLLKRSSLLTRNIETPLIHLKMKQIFKHNNILPGSYDYNEVIRIFTSIPKHELFRTPTNQLIQLVDDLFSISNPNNVYCFTINKALPKQIFLQITIPYTLFNAENIQSTLEIVAQEVPYESIEVIEVHGLEVCRLHVHLELQKTMEINTSDLEEKIQNKIKPWTERLRSELKETMSWEESNRLFQKYSNAFPDQHQLRRTPTQTIQDILFLEKMEATQSTQFTLVPFTFSLSVISGKASILLIYNKEKLDLINVMPVLQNLGIYVYDELTTRIGSTHNIMGYIHAFRVVDAHQNKLNEQEVNERFIPLLEKVFSKQTENDPLNALVISAGLDWREVNMLQTYRNLLLQISQTFTKDKINSVLTTHTSIIALLVDYFHTKFKPSKTPVSTRLKTSLPKIKQAFLTSLQGVSDVSDDLILKRVFNLLESTLRTNYYITKTNGDSHISIKIDSKQVSQMPTPTPFREIYIHDVNMEGVHIRFGKVARGGLRWSDRLDDFRTEVLGLVKAQQTKNVVIVPVGSKGGFAIKNLPKERDAITEEGIKQYKKFIRGLLDITDNIDPKGNIITPENVVIYDEQDPYLVVAADKGTAQFSDIANEVSKSYDFWLDDAFASGGSVGYNHKEVGITAKGAWECTKLHFKEFGKDIQKDAFTVAGVGDMSGDVFGNGMLLSKKIQLLAAFNHMHIFLDPTPDTDASWKERNRLFNLPRSTWEDYNPKLISQGGGCFNRKSKEIQLTPQIKAMLGLTADSVTGEELIKAILKMKVDLLWFGGIGTYIRDKNETNLEVGDPANDSVRITSEEVNAAVIGEGANLGLTQNARISYGLKGGRLNPDFIDNSAGVNMSDYEVNIKILLQYLLSNKLISNIQKRNKLLSDATDTVTELVLVNNRAQHRLISTDIIRSKQNMRPFIQTKNMLIAKGELDPKSENIPEQGFFDSLSEKGESLPRSILSILQSYVKMNLYNELLNSKLIHNDFFVPMYETYFPEEITKSYKSSLNHHRLKNEILATKLTNIVVNQAGPANLFHIQHITGKSFEEIIKNYMILFTAFDGNAIRNGILSSNASENDKYEALIQFEDTLLYHVAHALQLPSLSLEFEDIKSLKDILQTLAPVMSSGAEVQKQRTLLKAKKFSKEVCDQLAFFNQTYILVDILYLHKKHGTLPKDSLQVLVQLNDTFLFKSLIRKAQTLLLFSEWEIPHREVIIQTIRTQRLNLALFCINTLPKKEWNAIKADTIKKYLPETNWLPVDNYFKGIQKIQPKSATTLSSLTVTINHLSFVLSLA